MKKILLLLSIVFCSLVSFGQNLNNNAYWTVLPKRSGRISGDSIPVHNGSSYYRIPYSAPYNDSLVQVIGNTLYIRQDGASPATTGIIKFGDGLGFDVGAGSNVQFRGTSTGTKELKLLVSDSPYSGRLSVYRDNVTIVSTDGTYTTGADFTLSGTGLKWFKFSAGQIAQSSFDVNGCGFRTNLFGQYGYLRSDNLSGKQTYQLPDSSGTIALNEYIIDKYLPVSKLSGNYYFLKGSNVFEFGDVFSQTVVTTGYQSTFQTNGSNIDFQSSNTSTSAATHIKVDADNGLYVETTSSGIGTFIKTDSVISSSYTAQMPAKTGVQTFAMLSDIATPTTYTASNGVTLTGTNFTLDNSYFTGDATVGGGSIYVQAIRGKTIPTLASGNLKYTGSAWSFDNTSYATLASLSAISPVTYNSSTGTIGMQLATSTTAGYLSVSDWNTFNNKVSSQWTTTGAPNIYYTNGVMIGNASDPATKLSVVETSTNALRGISSYQYSTTGSAQWNGLAAGGTVASPVAVTSGRVLTNMNGWGYDGSNFVNSGSVRITASGTISAGAIPSIMELRTMNVSGTLTTGLKVDSVANVQINNNITKGNWQASIISPTYGGSGVNNGTFTTTLAGNFTTSGAFNTTLAFPRSTTYNYPNTANETLAGLGTAQTFTASNTFTPVQKFSSAGLSINDGTNDLLAVSSGNSATIKYGSGATTIQFGSTPWFSAVSTSISFGSTYLMRINQISSTSNANAIMMGAVTGYTGNGSSAGVRIGGVYIGSAYLTAVTSLYTTNATPGVEITSASNTGAGGTGSISISTGVNTGGGARGGLLLGTASTQPISFWGATAITQPTTSIASATVGGSGVTPVMTTTTFDGYSIPQLVKALRNLGILQ